MKVTTGQDTIINYWEKLMGPVSHFYSFDWSQKETKKINKKKINKRPIVWTCNFSQMGNKRKKVERYIKRCQMTNFSF